MRIEIFRAGTQTDSAGNTKEWSEADLETIRSSYDAKKHEAPVTIGHPKDNAPAWGWVKSVTREGAHLFAEIGDLHDDFVEMLKKKLFKKRSISLYPDLSLRHIAFLGAQPPAVKGLADFSFSDGVSFDFMDWEISFGFNSMGRLFQGLRDAMIADKKPIEDVDRMLPQYDIDSLKAMRAEAKDPFGYEEPSHGDPTMDTKELEAKNAEFAEKLATMATQVTGLTTALAASEANVAALQKDKKLSGYTAFAEKLIAAGKLTPARRVEAITIMETLDGQPARDFAEGTTTVKKTPLQVYQEGLEAGPVQVTFSETARKNNAAPTVADDKITALTEQYMKDHAGVSFSEASKAVLLANPDLNVSVDL